MKPYRDMTDLEIGIRFIAGTFGVIGFLIALCGFNVVLAGWMGGL